MSERREKHDHAHHSHAHDDHDHSSHTHHDHAHDHHAHGKPSHADHSHRDHAHHGHDHHHVSRATPAQRLSIAIALTGTFMLVEAIGGWLTGSLALLSDAGHMLTDTGALCLALFAQIIAKRARSGHRTFGHRRAEILAALLNGIVLAASSVWIVVEAMHRLGKPVEILGLQMLLIASVGLAINIVVAWVLARGGENNHNMRAAAAHVTADAVGSVAAMLAGVLAWRWGWYIADPIISVFIALLILWGAWKLVRDSVDVLMEGVPKGLDSDRITQTIAQTPGVAAIHDLHVWSISDGFPVVTVHVILDAQHHGTDVAQAVARRIRDSHGIEHVTVQPESPLPPLIPAKTLLRRKHS